MLALVRFLAHDTAFSIVSNGPYITVESISICVMVIQPPTICPDKGSMMVIDLFVSEFSCPFKRMVLLAEVEVLVIVP